MPNIENFIPLVAFAFALSMISERIANLAKLYIPALFRFWDALSTLFMIPIWVPKIGKKIGQYLPCLCRFFEHINDSFQFKKSRFVWENLNVKQNDEVLKTIRERIILSISIISGLVVALAFQNEIKEILGTVYKKCIDDWIVVLSFGVLFSFGSKFWHDMLDLLLFTKNIRRRLGDVNYNAIESAEQFETYIQSGDAALVNQILENNEVNLRLNFPGVRTIVPKYDLVGDTYQYCLVVYMEGPKPADFPTALSMPLANTKIPIKVIDNLGSIKAQGGPGDLIKIVNSNFFGSYGCMVKKDNEEEKYYILTCAHVITENKITFDANIFKRKIKVPEKQELSVSEENFLFDGGYDCALLGPVNKKNNTNRIDALKSLKPTRELTKEDKFKHTDVYVLTRKGLREGRIVDHAVERDLQVDYKDGSKTYSLLIMIEPKSGTHKFTEGGDSGSILYDKKGVALGLIIGADSTCSYAIPINDILAQFTVKIAS